MKRSLLLLAAGFLACTGVTPAQASNFSVSPIRLELASGQGATSLKVSNEDEEDKLLQVTVLRWTRDQGEDVYTAETGSAAPIVTPPLFRLAGSGGSQIVRIGFEKPLPAEDSERAWRVLIEEVPQPVSAATGAGTGSIAMRLRISLPLLLQPVSVLHQLDWSGRLAADGALQLTAVNRGNVSERVDEVKVAAAQPLARLSGPLYIFPGERRELVLKPASPLKPGLVKLLLQGTARPPIADLVLRAQ